MATHASVQSALTATALTLDKNPPDAAGMADENKVDLFHSNVPAPYKKKRKWVNQTDEHGNVYIINTQTGERKPFSEKLEDLLFRKSSIEMTEELDLKSIVVVKEPITILSSSQDIRNEVAFCLLDVINTIFYVQHEKGQERKRLKDLNRMNAFFDLPAAINLFEKELIASVPIDEARFDIEDITRRRQRIRLQGAKYRHLIINKVQIAAQNAFLKDEIVRKHNYNWI